VNDQDRKTIENLKIGDLVVFTRILSHESHKSYESYVGFVINITDTQIKFHRSYSEYPSWIEQIARLSYYWCAKEDMTNVRVIPLAAYAVE